MALIGLAFLAIAVLAGILLLIPDHDWQKPWFPTPTHKILASAALAAVWLLLYQAHVTGVTPNEAFALGGMKGLAGFGCLWAIWGIWRQKPKNNTPQQP